MNQEYWKDFYSNQKAPDNHSGFAGFICNNIKEGSTLVDLGCGNGRDTKFFLSKGILAMGIDLVPPEGDNFIVGDFTKCVQTAEIYYSRFTVHAIEEDSLDDMLKSLTGVIGTGHLCIETRSAKGLIEEDHGILDFASPIGGSHFRMLYTLEYLTTKLESFGFVVDYSCEDTGLAIYKEEDPMIVRIIARHESK
jgi:tellurite methyltransferase